MKLRIKNFRSLKDTGNIEIKPITVLVGRNSSGKSSFLRTFPMLKQSTQEKTISPILLYGDYVDFGSYKDIKPHFISDKSDYYELDFTLKNQQLLNMRNYSRFRRYREKEVNSVFDFNYSLKFSENKKQLIQINFISFRILNDTITLELDQESKKVLSIKLNDEMIFGIEDSLLFFDYGEFNVDIYIDRKNQEKVYESFPKLLRRKIHEVISKHLHGGTKEGAKDYILSRINFSSDEEMLNDIKKIQYPATWRNRTIRWDKDSLDFKNFKKNLLLFEFFSFYFETINMYLKAQFVNINYIAPLRATAERYYRIQQLAVDEVDQNGKNLPIFLGSLSDTLLSDFQNWTFENFDFKTKISKIEGHYSIKIQHEDKHEINLSDMGFGYSQILPILTQIWYSSKQNSKNRKYLHNEYLDKIIVIEQPELHLHPEFQAKFADAIAKIIKSSKDNEVHIKLILETHSDIIINRLGDCILNKQISNEDINIVIFNKNSETSPTEVNFAKYDSEGNLNNWPIGFFQPSII